MTSFFLVVLLGLLFATTTKSLCEKNGWLLDIWPDPSPAHSTSSSCYAPSCHFSLENDPKLWCVVFFFTWEWIINTTIMALTTIHNLVYKQLLWSIFPPQNAGGSLTSFFWTTCFFGFGNILNTYLKKYNNAAPLTLKYPHTSPTNFYLCVIFICNSYIFQKVHKLHMKVIHNQKREGN